MELTNKIREVLETQKTNLINEFEENRKKATFYMEKKKTIDGSLNILVQKGSLITAKIEAIKDMLNS